MLNLFDYLTEKDKIKIENYIYRFGIADNLYIGTEEYLKYWASCKKHLFHLLGGKLIYKFPFSFEKPKAQIKEDLNNLIIPSKLIDTIYNKINILRQDNIITSELSHHLVAILWTESFLNDAIPYTIKIKPNNYTKTLQLQKGMKPIRAIQKLIEYFNWDELKDPLEDFRIQHSMIYNDKYIKGNMCLSIHPLDFMTMSDNASNWSSCMSWSRFGCYHEGTVEMMNSNNVICCYIEAENKYNFNEDPLSIDENYIWNSKKWRQLFYITNEIAVCGKAYPYQNKEFSIAILKKIKELSEKNLKRTYSFGPEPYRDMINIGSKYRMDMNRIWIRRKETIKHNIIFDTKGMYNDMFNDHDGAEPIYWCYRNKVKKNTIISYSGKAPCLCCGNPVITFVDNDRNYDGAYNDRYDNTGSVVCRECKETYSCSICKDENMTTELYSFNGVNVCKDCLNNLGAICPCCGKPFLVTLGNNPFYIRKTDEPIYQQDFYGKDNTKMAIAYMCNNCKTKYKKYFERIIPLIDSSRNYYDWRKYDSYYLSKTSLEENSNWEKFLLSNLKKIDSSSYSRVEKLKKF